jgi:hypothetical protein
MAELSITMPRGDIRNIKFSVTSSATFVTDLTEIYFTVKRNYRNDKYEFQKTLSSGDIYLDSDNFYHFKINPEDTNNLDYGIYNFDIEILRDNVIKQTTVGELRITKEVTFASNEGV